MEEYKPITEEQYRKIIYVPSACPYIFSNPILDSTWAVLNYTQIHVSEQDSTITSLTERVRVLECRVEEYKANMDSAVENANMFMRQSDELSERVKGLERENMEKDLKIKFAELEHEKTKHNWCVSNVGMTDATRADFEEINAREAALKSEISKITEE